MPKRPRQAHIPSSPTKRRKTPRPRFGDGEALATSPSLAGAADGESVAFASPTVSQPATRRRRLDAVRAPQETVALRTVPGQLPTFERAYLLRELRQTGIISGVLLATIIVLTILLR